MLLITCHNKVVYIFQMHLIFLFKIKNKYNKSYIRNVNRIKMKMVLTAQSKIFLRRIFSDSFARLDAFTRTGYPHACARACA